MRQLTGNWDALGAGRDHVGRDQVGAGTRSGIGMGSIQFQVGRGSNEFLGLDDWVESS